MAEPVRLNKWIASQGIASRREADRLIAAGCVTVNGQTVQEMGVKVDPDSDRVEVDTGGQAERVYLAVNKPVGYTSDAKPNQQESKVVTMLVDVPEVFPIGRLDKASSGLILLTNDGTLATALTHPEAHKEKEYQVTVDQEIPDGALMALRKGIPMMGRKTLPSHIKRLAENRFLITLTEGRNRQVRRMCRKMGVNVTALRRIRIDRVYLGDLGAGEWRHLNPDEVAALKAPVGR